MSFPSVAVIGVPTSAGAHHAGQDQAPTALRSAGLVTRLSATGLDVKDMGDVGRSTFRTEGFAATARNLTEVVRVAEEVADAVGLSLADARLPVVVGGDCTISLGVLAGVRRHYQNAGLLYFDGDADLSTPEATGSGVLDSMGVAHLLGLTDNALARIGSTWPMLSERQLVLFGYDRSDLDAGQRRVLDDRPGLLHLTDWQISADIVGSAEHAVRSLTDATGDIVVHFDIDAVDARDLPLGNFPHWGVGVRLSEAAQALSVFYRAPQLRAAVLTEVNPSYDPAGDSLTRYVDAVAGALAGALTARV